MDNSRLQRAVEVYTIEAFTLLGISILVTGLRTYYRARIANVKRLQADDYFVVVGAVSCYPRPPVPGHDIASGIADSGSPN